MDPRLIDRHEAAVPDHIHSQNCGKPAFHTVLCHAGAPPNQNELLMAVYGILTGLSNGTPRIRLERPLLSNLRPYGGLLTSSALDSNSGHSRKAAAPEKGVRIENRRQSENHAAPSPASLGIVIGLQHLEPLGAAELPGGRRARPSWWSPPPSTRTPSAWKNWRKKAEAAWSPLRSYCLITATSQESGVLRAARKASWGIFTLPIWRMRFLPFFCFSRSLRLRVISPP